MAIRVRYTGTELCPEGVVELLDGDGYWVHEDGSVAIYAGDDEVGLVHPDRWQSVCQAEEPADDGVV